MQISPIRTNASNSFAHDTFARRLPQIIRDLQDNNNFEPSVQEALEDLCQQLLTDAPLPPPPLTAPDSETWLAAYEQHKGESWQNTEWFFAETYFFHQVNDIVRYWQNTIDRFHKVKADALGEVAFKQKRATLVRMKTMRGRLHELLNMALWANRADLSLPDVLETHGAETEADDLLIDERLPAIQRLIEKKGPVHIITDNFGIELMMDLALVDALVEIDVPVTMHVKMHPTYVSDATPEDVFWLLHEVRRNDVILFRHLETAAKEGRFRIAPNFFWNSPHFLDKLPAPLMKLFTDASLIILKGDANYRRAFFDTIWPVDKPSSEIVNYLPAPMLCLRTLKSDCLAGVPQEIVEQAAAFHPNWRTLGKFGVIQYIEEAEQYRVKDENEEIS